VPDRLVGLLCGPRARGVRAGLVGFQPVATIKRFSFI
jgi:hypothetical protein